MNYIIWFEKDLDRTCNERHCWIKQWYSCCVMKARLVRHVSVECDREQNDVCRHVRMRLCVLENRCMTSRNSLRNHRHFLNHPTQSWFALFIKIRLYRQHCSFCCKCNVNRFLHTNNVYFLNFSVT